MDQPLNFRQWVDAWLAYKAGETGQPAPPKPERTAQEQSAIFGQVVLDEMENDPEFKRLVMGKLAEKLIGP